MAILSSKQVKLATGLINESGFKLKEFNNRNVLKLQNGKTTIFLFPPKTKTL
jgi:hypothetical protein